MNAASLSSCASTGLSIRQKSGKSAVNTIRSRSNLRISGSCSSTTEKERGNRYFSSGSLYELLGLKAGATAEEIKVAYRKRARACHPDTVAVDRKRDSAEEFIKIHAAYATLSDPEKRADYDRKWLSVASSASRIYNFSAQTARSSSSTYDYATDSSSSFRYKRRTWETDQCW